MAKNEEVKSKRQVIREQRERKQRRQRLLTILGITVVALIVAGLLIAPSARNAMAPVGDIISITPEARPQPNGREMGDPSAPVLVEVWEDFQCPACQTFTQNVEPLITENFVATGNVRYVFRFFPFLDDRSASKESDQAAHASMCAADQNKFWEYHDMLYANWDGENRGAFSDKRLVAFAETLGLDMGEFNQCFEAGEHEELINQDTADGIAAGVSGTPTVFVNGTVVRPGFVPSYEELAQAIEAALGTSSQ
jgi:protein-disulfide isomerase